MGKAIYEGIYIKICFFAAKLSFEGSLMEVSGIMTIHRGKKSTVLNLMFFSNNKKSL